MRGERNRRDVRTRKSTGHDRSNITVENVRTVCFLRHIVQQRLVRIQQCLFNIVKYKIGIFRKNFDIGQIASGKWVTVKGNDRFGQRDRRNRRKCKRKVSDAFHAFFEFNRSKRAVLFERTFADRSIVTVDHNFFNQRYFCKRIIADIRYRFRKCESSNFFTPVERIIADIAYGSGKSDFRQVRSVESISTDRFEFSGFIKVKGIDRGAVESAFADGEQLAAVLYRNFRQRYNVAECIVANGNNVARQINFADSAVCEHVCADDQLADLAEYYIFKIITIIECIIADFRKVFSVG